MADPSDIGTIDSLQHLLRMEITVQVASEADIEGALYDLTSVSRLLSDAMLNRASGTSAT